MTRATGTRTSTRRERVAGGCRRGRLETLAARQRPGRGDRAGFEPIQALEDGERLVARRAAVDRRLEQPPRLAAVAALERRDARVQQLFRLALPLGERAAGPLDVRPRPRMTPIQKKRPRPDVDGVVVLRGEVMVEADEEELFDLRVPLRIRRGVGRAGTVGAKRIRHV